MSSCIVKGCTSSWRKKDVKVNLHSFPWDPERIKLWLLKSGQFDANIDIMVQKVLDGKVNDSYRMCSRHFEHQCYTYEEDRRRLRKDAVPSIFEPFQPTAGQQRKQASTSGQKRKKASTLSTPITIVPSSTMQHITPDCTQTTTTATFSIFPSGSHTFTTSALSLSSSISPGVSVISPVLPTTSKGSLEYPPEAKKWIVSLSPTESSLSIISEQTVESEQHSMESSSDLVPSVSPNTLIPQQTLPSVEIFPSPQSSSQGKENLTPQKRDFATNTTPYMFLTKKDLQKMQPKIKCRRFVSPVSKRSRAAIGRRSGDVPQMSKELIAAEIEFSEPEELQQERSNLPSYLKPSEILLETSTENMTTNGTKVTTTSRWSQKTSMPCEPRAALPNEIPEFIEEHNYSSNCIEQEDTDTFLWDPDPSDVDEPISPTAFHGQNEPLTASRLGKRRRVTIQAGSRCPTCDQIVGPSQDVTSEPSQRKEFAEKSTIFDRTYGTASKYVQANVRTFSVKSQCQKMRPLQKTSLKTSTKTSSAQKETELSHIPHEPLHTIPIASTPDKTIPHTQTTDPEGVHKEVFQAEPILQMDERGIPCIDSVASIGIKEEQPSWISIDSTQPNDSRAESHPLRRRKKSVDSIDDQLGDLEDSLSRMPACVVKGCSPADRSSETLYVFPRDKERIRTWLLATGQYSDNLEQSVNKIFEATKMIDSYWMCEKHFVPCFFIYNAKTGKNILTKNAVPTIFPQQNATAFSPATKRKRDEMSGFTQEGESEDSQEEEEVIFSERNLCDATPCYIHPVKQRKFIVFENSLDELILKIPCQSGTCTSPIIKIIKKRTGSYISIFVKCADHHYNLLWKSQPTVDGKPLGNVILASSLFASGNSFPKIRQFFHLANIMAMSENTYSKYKHEYIFPTIENSWKSSQMECIENVQGTPLCIAGDGRWDNNKYCVYSMMDIESKKILSFDVQQSAMGVSSLGSEKVACKKALDFLLKNEICVKVLCANRHFAIRKMIKEEYSTITHEFNVWQIAKSLGDKLLDASHEKNCEDLAEWVGAIQNHLRWCSDTYNEDDARLIAKWNSFLYHVQNVHAWEDKDNNFTSCQHEHLPEDTKRKRKWLKTNSPSFKALKKIILDKRLQKNIKRICHFCHNGDIEVFHSTILKYQSDQKEQQHFTMDEMYARTQLAALDHNSNCKRIQAMVRRPSRISAGSDRFKTVSSKDRKEWSVQAMYEPTNHDFLIDLIKEVVELVSGNRTFEWSSRTSLVPEDIVQDVKADVKSIGLAV